MSMFVPLDGDMLYFATCAKLRVLSACRDFPKQAKIWSNSDPAGVETDRKPVSGSVSMVGSCCVGAVALGKQVVASSNAQAKSDAIGVSAAIGTELQTMMKEVRRELLVPSSTAPCAARSMT